MPNTPVTIAMLHRAQAVIAMARIGAKPDRAQALEAAQIVRNAQVQRHDQGLSGIDLEPARRVVIMLAVGSRAPVMECIEAVR